jgi:hypothetical protein
MKSLFEIIVVLGGAIANHTCVYRRLWRLSSLSFKKSVFFRRTVAHHICDDDLLE